MNTSTIEIDAPGSYKNAGPGETIFVVGNTSGVDDITMDGDTSGYSEVVEFSTTDTPRFYQTSQTDISIVFGNVTLNLENAYAIQDGSFQTNVSYDNLSKSSYSTPLNDITYGMLDTNGTLASSFVGMSNGTMTSDVNNLLFHLGSSAYYTDPTGQGFTLSLASANSPGSSGGSVNVTVSGAGTNFKAVYENGDVVLSQNTTTGTKTYTIADAQSFIDDHVDVNVSTASYGFSLSESAINYYQTGTENLVLNKISSTNNVFLSGASSTTTVYGNNTADQDNYYINSNVSGVGDYTIAGTRYSQINVTNAGTVHVTGNLTYSSINLLGDINLKYSDMTWTALSNGGLEVQSEDYKVIVDNYISGSNTFYINGEEINPTAQVYLSTPNTVDTSINLAPTTINEDIYVSTQAEGLSYSDRAGVSTNIWLDTADKVSGTFGIDGKLYVTGNDTTSGSLNVNLGSSGSLRVDDISAMSLNGNTVSLSALGGTTVNVSNAVDYFEDSSDTLKVSGSGLAYNAVNSSLQSRTVVDATANVTASQGDEKFVVSGDAVSITDNASNNEFLLSSYNASGNVMLSSNDTLLLKGAPDYSILSRTNLGSNQYLVSLTENGKTLNVQGSSNDIIRFQNGDSYTMGAASMLHSDQTASTAIPLVTSNT